MRLVSLLHRIALCCAALACGAAPAAEPAPGANPVLRDRFTADPAPLVVGDTVYLYVGRDEAKGDEFFRMNEWLAYSSKDLRHWIAHGAFMKPTDFKWAVGDAWAAQVSTFTPPCSTTTRSRARPSAWRWPTTRWARSRMRAARR
ncbi:family 43 glycosylhydrolase [Pelomonas sp. Root1237]|uniref:family 43 glycosylhydrolase n=1 Tax=Pelomonas sp. Root1237 TaxID=1736434 RepID=UPI001F394C6E|nr:family 43 glycosylhydrolase [Pelomonas sp. Root1237]